MNIKVLSFLFLFLSSGHGMEEPRSLLRGQQQQPEELKRRIVVLKDNVPSAAQEADRISSQVGGQVGYVYEHALKGFSIMLPETAVAGIENNPNVKFVEEDYEVSIFTQTIPTGIQRIFADTNAEINVDGNDDYRVDVDVAVIDTGIDLNHPDLNVVGGTDCTLSSGAGRWRTYYCGGPSEGTGGDDDHYHGTHVAGTIAALDNGIGVVGVAPGARLWAVKVLDSSGSGYTSGIIAGIDWVTSRGDIEVANMSIGGSGYSQAEFEAIGKAVEFGVAFAVAAGNDDDDASNYSPAAFSNCLTVSALADFDGEPGELGQPTCRDDLDDTLADFSNWGGSVDIAAPGVCIYSTFPGGGYDTLSGTSMASPHVAGALALLASANPPQNDGDVYALYSKVIDAGNLEWVDDSGDTIQEPLLDVSDSTIFDPVLVPTGGGFDNPPVVTITSPMNGVSFPSSELIIFVGIATDNEDGDLSSTLEWTSNLDGFIDSGDTILSSTLSVGAHTIKATAMDSASNTGTDAITIEVTESSSGGIVLSVTAYKDRGSQKADLEWSPPYNVFVYRDDTQVDTASGGFYTDITGLKGGGSAQYKVCATDDTIMCSNEVNVVW